MGHFTYLRPQVLRVFEVKARVPELVVLVVLQHHQFLPVQYRCTLNSTTNFLESQVQDYSNTTNFYTFRHPCTRQPTMWHRVDEGSETTNLINQCGSIEGQIDRKSKIVISTYSIQFYRVANVSKFQDCIILKTSLVFYSFYLFQIL